MRNYIYILSSFAIMAISACTVKEGLQEQDVLYAPEEVEITVKAFAAGEDTDSPDSKATSTYDNENRMYTINWEDDDKFSVIRGGENKEYSKSDTGDNDFTGILPAGSGDCHAVFPVTAATDHTAATFDISDQTDEAAYVMYAVSNDAETYHFRHAMGFLRLNLPESLNGTQCDITITTPEGVKTDGTINLANGGLDYSTGTKNTISRRVEVNDNEPVLVAIPPLAADKRTLSVLKA